MGFKEWGITPATRNEAVAEGRITEPRTLEQQDAANNGMPIPDGISTSTIPSLATTPIAPVTNQQATNDIFKDSDLAKQAQSGTTEANKVAEAAGVSKYLNQDYVSPDYTNDDFLPGKGTPVRVGGYTGKSIGSVDFFAATGQYVPFNIIAKREAALDKARAAKKAKEATYKDPTVIDVVSPKYNENFKRAYVEGLDRITEETKAKFGDDFISEMQRYGSDSYNKIKAHQANYDYLGKNANELINNAANVVENVEKGGVTTFSKGQILAARSIVNSREGDVNDLVKNGKILDGYNSIENALFKIKYFDDLEASITSSITPGQDYLTETQVKSYNEQVQKQAETMKRDLYSGVNEVTVDMIKETIYAKVPRLGQTTKDVKMKPSTVAAGKEVKKQEGVAYRARKLFEAIKDPINNKENFDQVITSLKTSNVPYKKGIISSSELITPDFYNPSKEHASSVIDMFNEAKGWNYNPTIGAKRPLFNEEGDEEKDYQNRVKESLGATASGKIKEISQNSTNRNILEIVPKSGDKVSFDLSTSKGKSDWEDYVIGLDGMNPKLKNKNSVKLEIADKDGYQIGQSEYIDLESKDFYNLGITALNLSNADMDNISADEISTSIYDQFGVEMNPNVTAGGKTVQNPPAAKTSKADEWIKNNQGVWNAEFKKQRAMPANKSLSDEQIKTKMRSVL